MTRSRRRAWRLSMLATLLGIATLAVAVLTSGAQSDGTTSSGTPLATPAAMASPTASATTPEPTPELIATGDAPFSIQATPAFGGAFKIGEWLPVFVEIENHGPDTRVEIRATTGPSGSATTFVVPVDLPAGTRKSVTLYTLPEALPRTFEVLAVETGEGDAAAVAEVRVNPLFQTDMLCGLVGYPEGSLTALGRVRAAGGQPGMGIPESQVSVAPIDIATFPTMPEGLYSFDCIVVGGATGTAPLGPEGQAALSAWVHRGGQLFIASGERWQSALASIPAELIPVTVARSQTVTNLAPLADLAGGIPPESPSVIAVAALNEAQSGALVLAALDALPLVVERTAGDGRVTFLAFDPDIAPIAEWDGADDLWKGLLRTRSDQDAWRGMPPDINPRQIETAPLVGALSQIPALDLPSIKLLAGLLGAYLLAISPINYLVLRRLNKLSWAWATTLVLVGVFALASYGLGSRIRGSDVIVNTISIVQSDGAADGPITARTFVGLFSPSKTSYEVDVGGTAGSSVLLSQMPPSADPWSGMAQSGGGTLVQGAPAQVRDLGVSQWASRFFMAEHHPSDAPRVIADLHFEADALRGTVTNAGTIPLRDGAIFVGAAILQIGELAPGETKPVDLDLSGRGQNGNMNGMPLSMLLLGADPTRGWPDLSNNREMRMREMVLSTLFGYGMNGPLSPAGVNFVGWAHAPLVPITVTGQRVSTVDTLLLTSRLPVTFGADSSGTVNIPSGVIAPLMTQVNADSAFVIGSDVQVFSGSAEIDFAIPSDARPDTITNLTLRFPDAGMMGPLPDSVQIFDWEADQFVDLEDYTGNVTIENADRYFDPVQGLVRLKISAGMNNPTYLTVNISLSGTREVQT